LAGISLIANRDSVTLYRTFSYRDGGKNPRNTRKTIGKVVPGTNRIVINDYFLKLMASQGLSPPDLSGKSLSEIARLVDFKMEVDSGDFKPRRLHHDRQIEIADPRLERLSRKPSPRGKGSKIEPRPAGRAQTGRAQSGRAQSGRANEPLARSRQASLPFSETTLEPSLIKPDPLDRGLRDFVRDRLGVEAVELKFESKEIVVKSVGAQLILEKAAESSRLKKILAGVFPDVWPEILAMAFHLATGGGLADCPAKLGRVGSLIGEKALDDGRMEEVLASMDEARRLRFYEAWAKRLSESSVTAYDLPVFSFPVSANGDVFRDFARSGREGEGLNLAVLWGDSANLPVRLSAYPGRPSDAQAFIETASKLPGPKPRLAMGQRFYDRDNLNAILSSALPGGFLARVPLDSGLAKKFIGQFGAHLYVVNYNHNNDKLLFAYSVDLKLSFQRPLKIHLFLDERANFAAEKAVYQDLFRLKRDIESSPERLSDPAQYQDLFRFEPDSPSGPLMVKHNQAATRYRDCGWLLVLTDLETSPAAVLGAFEVKESLKAHFQVIRDGLSLAEPSLEGAPLSDRKIFLGLIALILMSEAGNTLKLHNLSKEFSVPALLRNLEGLMAVTDGKAVICTRLDETQRRILEAFGVGAGPKGPKSASLR
jgi:hypothetical protein